MPYDLGDGITWLTTEECLLVIKTFFPNATEAEAKQILDDFKRDRPDDCKTITLQ